MSFIKDTEKFGRCMELINAAVNPYHIKILKKQLDKVEILNIYDVDKKWLIYLLDYQNINV